MAERQFRQMNRRTKSVHLIAEVQAHVQFDMHSRVAGMKDRSQAESKLHGSIHSLLSTFYGNLECKGGSRERENKGRGRADHPERNM